MASYETVWETQLTTKP